MLALPFTAAITVLTAVLLFVIASCVGAARGKYGIKAPATTGDPNFERWFRVHANTVENTVMFLPLLWLFAFSVGDRWAGVVGLVWLVGRAWYAAAYAKDAAKRGPGFTIALAAVGVLATGAIVGVVRTLISLES